MQINILTVGNLKEEYLKQAYNEYVKRLSKFCTLNTIELKEENITDKNLIAKALETEADEIIKRLKGYIIALDINGKSLTSEQFAKTISDVSVQGYSQITFVIGSSFGLSEKVKQKAHLKLSFSALTFPHQLFRVMLVEQIYRAFAINNNIKYHK